MTHYLACEAVMRADENFGTSAKHYEQNELEHNASAAPAQPRKVGCDMTNAARCERVGYHGRYNGRTTYEYRLRD